MINIESMVRLWRKTQIGHYLKCREAQLEFSDIMWDLCKELEKEGTLFPEQQCFGDETI